jgi:DNA modification methylase
MTLDLDIGGICCTNVGPPCGHHLSSANMGRKKRTNRAQGELFQQGTLYYGDNLKVLRQYIKDESVDLIYLDPPFNSKRDYNIIYKEADSSESAAQKHAFTDSWHWDFAADAAYRRLTGSGAEERGVPSSLVTIVEALRRALGTTDLLAYIVMMTERLIELRRVLKINGTLYLHCDPTASHHLRLILDSIFGPENFQNEIVWRRSTPKGLTTRRLTRNHDNLLCYTKSDQFTWNSDATFQPYDSTNLDEKTAKKYCHRDPDGRIYRLSLLTNPNPNRPNLTYEFLGVTRVWRWTKDRMQKAYEDGLVVQTKPGTVPQFKRYLDKQRGKPLDDVWVDIPPVNSQANERIGYPTQKPVALLERIISASSNAGDTVLDPFCGCGTTIEAAQKLGRKWVGIDITHLAIDIIKDRLEALAPGRDDLYTVIGEPVDVESARKLAEEDPEEFQRWAVPFIGARHVGDGPGAGTFKRGRDRGIDGIVRFQDDPSSASKRVIVSVKAGQRLNPAMVRDLRGTMEREGAPIGVLLTMYEPTKDMRLEAAQAGAWRSSTFNIDREYQRIQIITIAEAFGGKRPMFPGEDRTRRSSRPPAAMPPDPDQTQVRDKRPLGLVKAGQRNATSVSNKRASAR